MLTTNMRLTVDARPEDVSEIREFAEFILKVGDGYLGEAKDEEMSSENGVNPLAPNPSHNSNLSLLSVLGRDAKS
ncbi:hypothetical protein Tco_1183168 [Tanacetum coccineum]